MGEDNEFDDPPPHILLVEDDRHDRIAFCRAMEGWTISECERADDAQTRLAYEAFDLVVVDNHLPGRKGVEFCRDVLARSGEVPLVILTGTGSEELAAAALKSGVADYIIKDQEGLYLDLLPYVLPEIIQRHRAQRARHHAEAAVEESAYRLAQIVDGSPVAAFVLDREHRVTHWNHACAVLTGMPTAQTIGTREQWRAFYPSERPVMADLIVDGVGADEIEQHYGGKWRRSDLIEDAYEAEDFFPRFGEAGRWLFFTAAPLRDAAGNIVGAIETLQDFTERRRAEAALKESEERYRQLSITDGLTGLYNSRHFYRQLAHEVERTARYRHPLSMLLIDADHFKEYNDRFGHLAGDRALVALADCIRICLRRADSAYRYGGEEFVVLLPETTLEAAYYLAERIRGDFAAVELCPEPGTLASGTISIGVAEYRDAEAIEDFVRRADACAYEAKHAGRNCVVVARS